MLADVVIKKKQQPCNGRASEIVGGVTRRYHRLARLQQLLTCGQLFDISALELELKVSRRSIFRDLTVLRDAGIETPHSSNGTHSPLATRIGGPASCGVRPI